MKRKMWISVWLMSLLCVFSGYAQNEGNESSDKEQSDNRYNRREQWYVQLQGGANYFFAENNRFESFGKGISYSYAFSVGKNFTPVWGARLQLSGGGDQGMHDAWEGSPKYDFQHIGGIAAVTFNLTNCIRDILAGDLMSGVSKIAEVFLIAVFIALGAAMAVYGAKWIFGI